MSEQPTVVTGGQPQPFSPYAQNGQQFGPQFGAGSSLPAQPPLPEPPKRGKVGVVIASVVGGLVVLGVLGFAALFLFGTKTIQPESVQKEVVRVTQEAVGVAPTDVRCPDDVEAKAGVTFTCTAQLEGQPITYRVTETDDKGSLTIKNDLALQVTKLTTAVAGLAEQKLGFPVQITCDTAGKTVLVQPAGTPIHCTMTNAADQNDSAPITVKVDADGNATYTFDS